MGWGDKHESIVFQFHNIWGVLVNVVGFDMYDNSMLTSKECEMVITNWPIAADRSWIVHLTSPSVLCSLRNPRFI